MFPPPRVTVSIVGAGMSLFVPGAEEDALAAVVVDRVGHDSVAERRALVVEVLDVDAVTGRERDPVPGAELAVVRVGTMPSPFGVVSAPLRSTPKKLPATTAPAALLFDASASSKTRRLGGTADHVPEGRMEARERIGRRVLTDDGLGGAFGDDAVEERADGVPFVSNPMVFPLTMLPLPPDTSTPAVPAPPPTT